MVEAVGQHLLTIPIVGGPIVGIKSLHLLTSLLVMGILIHEYDLDSILWMVVVVTT